MSDETPETWPLRPSYSASALHGLCMTLADLVREAGGPKVSRRSYLKLCAVTSAAELLAAEVSQWFGTRLGEDEDQLEFLEDRYEKERKEQGAA